MGFFSSKPADTRPAILVVDDSALIVMSIKMILDPAGYEVIECSNGPDAVKFAEAKAPQLILLDMMMPGMDGIETLARLKSNAKTSPIPVLMVTGSQAGKDVDLDAIAMGAAGDPDLLVLARVAVSVLQEVKEGLGQRRRVDAGKRGDAAVAHERLQPDRPGVAQTGKLVEIAGHETAQEGEIRA